MLRVIFILASVFSVALGRGVSTDSLVPDLDDRVRELTEISTKRPILNHAHDISGDFIGTFFSAFSNVPIAIARSFGEINGVPTLPTLLSDHNLADETDSIFADYNRGLSNEDRHLSCDQLIAKYGFPVEKHETTTEDGYILTMFRIPGNGSVVFLLHGLLGSSDDYVVAGPDSGIAYLLARDGYDVWLGNARGNKHSRRHIKKKPSKSAFWNFSWHEIGYYDVPAMIDYALFTTGQKTLKYIGHSQGTTSFWVMGSERPEYNDKISLMVALSPVAFMSNLKSPIIRLMAPTGGLLHALTQSVGLHEMLPDNNMMKTYRRLVCGTGPLAEILCANVLFMISGFNVEQLNITNLPVIYGHVPSGASAKQFAHYSQGIISKKFRQFDYGPVENFERYGSVDPPDYALGNLKAPVSLVYSDADWLADPRDVEELYGKLPNVVDVHKVKYTNFNHLDFIFAKDVKFLIYKRLSRVLSHF